MEQLCSQGRELNAASPERIPSSQPSPERQQRGVAHVKRAWSPECDLSAAAPPRPSGKSTSCARLDLVLCGSRRSRCRLQRRIGVWAAEIRAHGHVGEIGVGLHSCRFTSRIHRIFFPGQTGLTALAYKSKGGHPSTGEIPIYREHSFLAMCRNLIETHIT